MAQDDWEHSEDAESDGPILYDTTKYRGPDLRSVWSFPHPPREEQVQTMAWLEGAARGEARFLSAEAPVGVGKSPIAVTFAEQANGTILVPQNSLQQQYLRDWKEMAHLRGSANYVCPEGTKDHPSCRRSKCTMKKAYACPYSNDKQRWATTPGSMTSYAMFFALLIHGEPDFIKNPWIVADESHNLDEAIISASEVSFSETDFYKHTQKNLPFGEREGDGGYDMEYADLVLRQMEGGLSASIGAMGSQETDESIRWVMLRDLILLTLDDMRRSHWVCDKTEPDHRSSRPAFFYVKPLLPSLFFKQHLSRFRILALSATPIASAVASKLYDTTVIEHVVGSPFPIENRPILYRPVANMSYKNYQTSLPTMARGVERTMAAFASDKGIIHTASFKLANDLYTQLPVDARRRILLHKQGMKRDELIQQFQDAKGPVVFMSPSITEGLDLKGDAGRFNIIAKVPYPALSDPWVLSRKSKIAGWYDWRTALAIAQASGRTTRAVDDWSTTVILDQCFGNLYNNQGRLFPKWFSEALSS